MMRVVLAVLASLTVAVPATSVAVPVRNEELERTFTAVPPRAMSHLPDE